MHSSILHPLFTSTLLAVVVHGFNLDKATDGAPRVVSLPMRKQHNPAARLARRQDTQPGTLDVPLTPLDLLGYTVQLSVGTPPQNFTLLVDTGSSDLWVASKKACESEAKKDLCEAFGSFSANDSSTYAYRNSNLNLTYADKSHVTGDYVTDSVAVGNVTVEEMQLGIGYVEQNMTGFYGVIGVSYPLQEGAARSAINTTANITYADVGNASYPNFPARLARDGFIRTTAYSLWLNNIDADEGTILFGGIDTERFDGSLTALPIAPMNNSYVDLQVGLDSVSVDGNVAQNTSAIPPAVLDSGSSLISLPVGLALSLYEMLDVVWDANSSMAFCECSVRDHHHNVTFTFSQLDVNVSMKSLVIDTDRLPARGFLADYDDICRFGIEPQFGDGVPPILGDTFLRSVYAVYDLENHEISLAQARYGSPRSNIVEIGSDGAHGMEASPRQEGDPDGSDDSDSSAWGRAAGIQLAGLVSIFVSGFIVM